MDELYVSDLELWPGDVFIDGHDGQIVLGMQVDEDGNTILTWIDATGTIEMSIFYNVWGPDERLNIVYRPR